MTSRLYKTKSMASASYWRQLGILIGELCEVAGRRLLALLGNEPSGRKPGAKQ